MPKSKIWEFLPGFFLRHFLKDQKLGSYGKIRKIYSSVWEKWAKKSKFDQNRPKIENKNFPADMFFAVFLKDQQIGSYGKNQENL